MEAENRRRRDAIAAGAVVYGASAYTAETYYAYVNSNLALDLRQALEEDVLARTEGDLRAWYEANAQRFRTPDQIFFRRISVGFEDGGRDAALERIGRAAGELAAGRDFGAVAASCGGAGAEEQMGPETIRSYSKYEEAIYNAALVLSPGGVSAPFESGGAYVILYCTARTPGTVPDFDQIRSEAEVLFSNEVFDDFLQNKIQEATISWVG